MERIENKVERNEWLQLIYLIVIIIFIGVMIITIITFVKNKNLIVSDPLNYGMEIHNFTSCTCFDNQGNHWLSTENGFVNKRLNNYETEIWVNQK